MTLNFSKSLNSTRILEKCNHKFLLWNWENPFDGPWFHRKVIFDVDHDKIYFFILFFWENTASSSKVLCSTDKNKLPLSVGCDLLLLWHVTHQHPLWNKFSHIFVLFSSWACKAEQVLSQNGLWSPRVSLKTTVVDGWLAGDQGRREKQAALQPSKRRDSEHDLTGPFLSCWESEFLILLIPMLKHEFIDPNTHLSMFSQQVPKPY